MTRRYTSGFDILGFDTDPTPGDPDLIMSQIVPTYQSIGDDAEAALNVLNSNAIENGAGQTMQALQNLIGTSFPPKLQTAADSYHSAASIYTAYAQALSEAQNQLDRAMDQAVPVAAMANATVQPAPPSASADQVAAVQQQQQSVDDANSQLTAAKLLAQDAQDMRTQAGNTFNTNLNDVSSIPDLSTWQKFLNWFEHSPIFQIIVDVAIAIVSIFCPFVGLALGVLAFGLFTAFNTIANGGHLDVGMFVVGLFTLALGGAGAAVGTAAVFAKLSGYVVKAGKGIGSVLHLSSGSAAKGILSSVKAVLGKADSALSGTLGKTGYSFVKSAGGNFAFDSVTGLASNGIGDAIDHKQFTGQDAGAIFAGAAAGGIVGGAVRAVKTGFGFDPPDPEPTPEPPPVPVKDPGMEPPPVPPKGPRPLPTSPVPPKDSEPTLPGESVTGGDASSMSGEVSATGGVVGSDSSSIGHAYSDAGSLTDSEVGATGGYVESNASIGHGAESVTGGDASSTISTNSGIAGSDVGHAYSFPWVSSKQQQVENAFTQAGGIGNDLANGGVQIAVGQAIGNTTGTQQDPPGQQAGQDGQGDLPGRAVGPYLNAGDIIGGITEGFKGE
jgi:hypothetical protein